MKNAMIIQGRSALWGMLLFVMAVLGARRVRGCFRRFGQLAIATLFLFVVAPVHGHVTPLNGAASVSPIKVNSDHHRVVFRPQGLLPIRVRSQSCGRRKGPRSKAEIERERQDRIERTKREIDLAYADYLQRFARDQSTATAVIYARFSTERQDSIIDQVRVILDWALAQKIFVPRENIFYDAAVSGRKANREGLAQAEAVLGAKKATVFLLFSTSRLHRKVYRTLELVERLHKGMGVRIVFVKSGIDTRDAIWEMALPGMAMVDQLYTRANVANIQAAQEGLLKKKYVVNGLAYGYMPEPNDGPPTKRGLPRMTISIDPVTSEIVKQIFRWYVDDGLSINEIVQRLNADPEIPLPSGCRSGQWKRAVVSRLLRNRRYRGLWPYSEAESEYVHDKDYFRRKRREAPLAEIQHDDLRIIDDAIWHSAQVRLSKRPPGAGRRPKDGDQRSRPKLLNHMFHCNKHERLHVAGTNGHQMHCPRCNPLPWAERELVSDLNRELAHKLTFQKLADLIRGDQDLLQRARETCDAEVAAAQRPDPATLEKLRKQRDRLQRSIRLAIANPGDTEEDEAETKRVITDFRRERAGVLAQIVLLEEALKRTPKKPTDAEIGAMVADTAQLLALAANGDDVDAATVQQIVELLTGGEIKLYQMGERKRRRGWLQGRFRVYVLPYLVEQLTGVPATCTDESVEVVIDYKRPLEIDELSERAWALKDKLKYYEIAKELKCSTTWVTKLMKHAAAKRGLPFEDGRKRRARIRAEQPTCSLSTRVAARVMELYQADWLIQDIAKECKASWETVQKIVHAWHTERGLPVPDGRSRLNEILRRKAQQEDCGDDRPAA